MPIVWTILPSPLLPAQAYESLVGALRRQHYDAALADASGATSGSELVDRWSVFVRSARPVALVAHSNSGYLAPAVRARAHLDVPIVFMDAALPPERGATRLAPPQFREGLRDLVEDDGRLPPWTRWYPREAMNTVIPAERFERIDGICPRLPLRYFDTEVTVPDGWAGQSNAYLAFGDTYAEETAFAQQQGWPTLVESGLHLQFLWQPEAVAHMVTNLLERVADT